MEKLEKIQIERTWLLTCWLDYSIVTHGRDSIHVQIYKREARSARAPKIQLIGIPNNFFRVKKTNKRKQSDQDLKINQSVVVTVRLEHSSG